MSAALPQSGTEAFHRVRGASRHAIWKSWCAILSWSGAHLILRTTCHDAHYDRIHIRSAARCLFRQQQGWRHSSPKYASTFGGPIHGNQKSFGQSQHAWGGGTHDARGGAARGAEIRGSKPLWGVGRRTAGARGTITGSVAPRCRASRRTWGVAQANLQGRPYCSRRLAFFDFAAEQLRPVQRASGPRAGSHSSASARPVCVPSAISRQPARRTWPRMACTASNPPPRTVLCWLPPGPADRVHEQRAGGAFHQSIRTPLGPGPYDHRPWFRAGCRGLCFRFRFCLCLGLHLRLRLGLGFNVSIGAGLVSAALPCMSCDIHSAFPCLSLVNVLLPRDSR